MTIVLTGGGSGGHITPILAVAAELKRQRPDIKLVYIGQKGDNLGDIPANDSNIDETFTVRAGKFRRYNSEGLKQLLDVSTMIKNIRDLVFVLIGIYQSRRLIKRIKPTIVFSRGGYVSVPVCLGAKFNKVPYITHDSDPIPSLANRLIAPWATLHFVALPKEIYKKYAENKTVTTGIPLNSAFAPVSNSKKAEYRKKLGINVSSRLLFVIGGGLGAQSLNDAVCETLPNLLAEFRDLQVVHITGRVNFDQVKAEYAKVLTSEQQGRVKLLDYTNDVYLYSGVADLIITRAGATNLAEFAVQGKACIVVPSTYLTGGHQLKNAEFLEHQHAAIVVNDIELATDSNKLAKEVSRLLKSPDELKVLGTSFAKFAKPNADEDIAKRILNLVDK